MWKGLAIPVLFVLSSAFLAHANAQVFFEDDNPPPPPRPNQIQNQNQNQNQNLNQNLNQNQNQNLNQNQNQNPNQRLQFQITGLNQLPQQLGQLVNQFLQPFQPGGQRQPSRPPQQQQQQQQQQQGNCQTFENTPGFCTGLPNCPELSNLLRNSPPRRANHIFRRSRCPASVLGVCCPLPRNNNNNNNNNNNGFNEGGFHGGNNPDNNPNNNNNNNNGFDNGGFQGRPNRPNNNQNNNNGFGNNNNNNNNNNGGIHGGNNPNGDDFTFNGNGPSSSPTRPPAILPAPIVTILPKPLPAITTTTSTTTTTTTTTTTQRPTTPRTTTTTQKFDNAPVTLFPPKPKPTGSPGLITGEDDGNPAASGERLIVPPDTGYECGFSNTSHPRIVGGHDSEKGAWPWMAALGYRDADSGGVNFLCGGALVSAQHVVTASHCVHDRSDLAIVRLGDLNLFSDDDGVTPIDVPVAEVIKSPIYDPATFQNDIAVIKLKEKVPFSLLVHPICLPYTKQLKNNRFANTNPFVAGWGAIQFNGPSSVKLREVQLPVVDDSVCQEKYKPFKTSRVDDTNICAGFQRGGKDACQGDSGGPLMQPISSSKYALIGVVSYGFKCAEPGFPGVYSRVTSHVDWILDVIRKTS